MNSGQTKKTALITGASGGIGKAFAELLANDGYDLILVARSGDELNRIAGMEMTRNETKTIVLPMDLAADGAVDKLVADLKERAIVPDIIINNAGIGLVGETAKLPIEKQMAIIDLNIKALTKICLRFVPQMIERGTGGIINVSSVAAFMPGPYMSVYYASKAYVQSFSDGLANELRNTKIKVMTLCPGPVDTGFQANANMDTKRLVYKLMGPKSAHDVALDGWAGFKAGNKVVVPGIMNLLTVWSAKFMPKALMMPIVRLFQKPK